MTEKDISILLGEKNFMSLGIFGGLPWNLFFKKRPDFSHEGKVFNCILFVMRGRPYTWDNVKMYWPIYGIDINGYTIIKHSERPLVSLDFSDNKMKLYIATTVIQEYLQEQKTSLLPYWFKELNRVNTGEIDSSQSIPFLTLKNFLEDDFITKGRGEDHEAIVENYKSIFLEMIPREEDDEFFSFFVSQKVLKKADEGHYTLLHNITPEEFKSLSSEAKANGYISYELKGPEIWDKIYMNDKKEFYSKETWRKGKKAITKEGGKYKPKFLKEIYDKERG